MKRKLVLVILIVLFSKLLPGQTETYTVKKTSFSSDRYDEFSPQYFGKGIVFSSNRTLGFSNHSNSQNKGLFKIYYIDTTGHSDWESARIFSKNLTSILNDGPVTFNKSMDTIYFSRNLDVTSKMSTISSPRNKLGIFSAVLEDRQWTKIRDLRINNEWYNVTTPCLSPDGKRLYFASDKSGGFGGMDLYYSDWKNEYWSDPVNLGPVINTSGNEAYPYVNQSGDLYFSSDGHKGLGGKDIFFSHYSDSAWLPPVHLEAPINSQYDDFGLIGDSVMNEGYFSSKRDNTIDIYHFKTNIHQLSFCRNQRTNQYCFKFRDATNLQIDDAYLQNVWSFGDGTKVTGQNVEHCFPRAGKYSVRLDVIEKKSGRIFFTKSTYDIELKDIEQPIIESANSALADQLMNFYGLNSYFPGSKFLSFTWYFGDGGKTTGPNVSHAYKAKGEYEVSLGIIGQNEKTKMIFNACTSKKIRVFDNNQDKKTYDILAKPPDSIPNIFNYDHVFVKDMYSVDKELHLDVVFHVEILTSKTRLNLDNIIFNNVPKKYTLREIRLKNENLFSYVIDEEMNFMSTYATYNEIVDLGYTDTKIRSFVLEDPASRELNNLKKVFGVSTDEFFNFNDFTLTSKGTQLLDQVIGFMLKYPLIQIEVAVHTDNSNTQPANQLLSQKRAESMVNYMITNGVNGIRLIPRGYGGSRPLISNYLDKYRKANRRIDLLILR